MAPRAGFEVDRKFLSAHVDGVVNRAEYPQLYPTRSEPWILKRPTGRALALAGGSCSDLIRRTQRVSANAALRAPARRCYRNLALESPIECRLRPIADILSNTGDASRRPTQSLRGERQAPAREILHGRQAAIQNVPVGDFAAGAFGVVSHWSKGRFGNLATQEAR
jgi:hypothetical protein